MNSVDVTAGTPWTVSAISNAEFAGARLRDILKDLGVADDEAAEAMGIQHVQFHGVDGVETSIPIRKALSSGRRIRHLVLLIYIIIYFFNLKRRTLLLLVSS
jgi:DMSO/TMAO reductase YedYZ molybdopterin-dependent catalytic subunit